MIQRMGRGWCFTFIALVCIAAMPMLWVELRWGPVWREERRVRSDSVEEMKRQNEEMVKVRYEEGVTGENRGGLLESEGIASEKTASDEKV